MQNSNWLFVAAAYAAAWIVIGGYAYLTDSSRVRTMAQSYLSHLLGGRVEIGVSTLTCFEGLRVDDVKVYVDPGADKPAGSAAPSPNPTK